VTGRSARLSDRATLAALHARVVDGDGAAVDEMAAALVAILRRELGWARARRDPHVVEMAIDDAVRTYLGAPASYEARRGSLVGWLAANVFNRLTDADRARGRRRAHEVQSGVDLAVWGARLDGRDSGETREAWIVGRGRALLRAARTAEERAFVRALVGGEPREAWAAALGVGGLPAREQRAAIWRVCARLRHRLRRTDHRRRA
jgi:hypothetical protein